MKQLYKVLPPVLATFVFEYASSSTRPCFSNGFVDIIVYSKCGEKHCKDMLINCDICSNYFLKQGFIDGVSDGWTDDEIALEELSEMWELLEDE
jgi:hypothetical protein